MPSPSDSFDPSNRVPIYLNVYDVTNINNYLYWFGCGIFHSGIEAHGVEYAFGAHEYPTPGVFEVEPKNCPGFVFRKTIVVGTTDKDPLQFRAFMEQLSLDYAGNSYHLLARNCNHFTDEVCVKLTKRPAPSWINRLARIATFCSCLLPESLQISPEQDPAEYHYYGNENIHDFYNEEQHLLRAPRGNEMHDHFYEASSKGTSAV